MGTHIVNDYLESITDGTVFITADVPAGASHDSLKVLLSKAVTQGRIVRIMRGIYYKPRYNRILGINVPYNTDDVAQAIARSNGWRIIPGANTCLNITGLSTQVPSRITYFTDGPYKKYTVNNMTLEFQHRAPKDMPSSNATAILVQALKARGYGNCDGETRSAIRRYIDSKADEDFIANSCNVTQWIRELIREVVDA